MWHALPLISDWLIRILTLPLCLELIVFHKLTKFDLHLQNLKPFVNNNLQAENLTEQEFSFVKEALV